MQCPKCGSAVYDNRPKKLAGTFKASAPDFKCTVKTCDWVQWPPKAGAAPAAPPPQGFSQPPVTPGVGHDAEIVALYWNSLDAIMAGIVTRKLTEYFKPENVVAMTAALYIQRARG